MKDNKQHPHWAQAAEVRELKAEILQHHLAEDRQARELNAPCIIGEMEDRRWQLEEQLRNYRFHVPLVYGGRPLKLKVVDEWGGYIHGMHSWDAACLAPGDEILLRTRAGKEFEKIIGAVLGCDLDEGWAVVRTADSMVEAAKMSIVSQVVHTPETTEDEARLASMGM